MNRRLPNGDTSTDADTYCEAWHALAKPFEKIGWRLDAYDPSLVFTTKSGSRVVLSLDVARELTEFINKIEVDNA